MENQITIHGVPVSSLCRRTYLDLVKYLGEHTLANVANSNSYRNGYSVITMTVHG